MWTKDKIQTKGLGWFPESPDVYNQFWNQRNNQYPLDEETINEYKHIADKVDQEGFHVIKNMFTEDEIDLLYDQTKQYFEVDDLNQIQHKKVTQPLINSPEIIPYVFNDHIMRIAMSFMQCYPALGTLNFRKSFVNDIPESGVLMFHVDPNSPRFLKFFIYLHDVDEDGGPFCIVKKSAHATHHDRWLHHRWPEDEIRKHYKDEDIVKVTAKKGDMIVASTSNFHRGTKCLKNERTMLTINYVIHPEEFKAPTFQIRQSDVDKLPDYKKPLTDFLIKI